MHAQKLMPDPTKHDRRLPRGVTIEDLSLRKRCAGLPPDPYICRYLAKALIPGTRRYKSKAFHKRHEGIAWAEKTRARLMARLEPSARCRIEDHREAYLDTLRSRRLSEFYIRQAEVTLECLVQAGARDLSAPHFYMLASDALINRRAITEAGGKVRRQTKTKLTPSTINRYVAHAKAFSTWCFQEGLTVTDVLARLRKLREEKRVKPTLTWQELRILLADDLRDEPFWLMAAIMVYSGMRAGEVAFLRWDDVLLDEQMLVVRLPPKQGGCEFEGMRQKSKAERFVPLQPELRDILTGLDSDAEGFVVPDDRYRRAKFNWRTGFDSLLKTASLPKRRGVSPHSFRHSYTALMAVRTGDMRRVQQQLGHASVRTTESYASCSEAYRAVVAKWPSGDDLWIRRLLEVPRPA